MPSDRRGLAGAALILVAGFVGSRLTGLARDVAISARFGTSGDLDAYLAAFRLPDLVFQLFAGAVLGSAFIPTFAAYLAQGKAQEGWRVASAVINLIFLVTAVAVIAGELAAPLLVPALAPGFPPEKQAVTVELTRLMLLSPLLFCLSGLVTAILQAKEHFLLPAVAPVLYNLCIAAAALFLGGVWGIDGLAFGVVAGAALHLLVQAPALARVGMRYAPVLLLGHAGVRQVLRLMGPRIIGLAAIQLNWVVMLVLASTTQEGSVSALNYAWLVVMMPLGVFGIAIAQAIFPRLAHVAAQQAPAELKRLVATGLAMGLFFSIPATVGLVVLRAPLVAALFQRGQFDAESTRLTAAALGFFALGLVPNVGLEIVTRGFYALQDTRTPVLLTVAALGLFAAAGFLLLHTPLGYLGLALGLSLATTCETSTLVALFTRRVGGMDWSGVVASTGRSLLATAGMLVLLAPAAWRLETLAGATQAAITALTILLAAALYFLLALVLKSPEAQRLLALARRVPLQLYGRRVAQ